MIRTWLGRQAPSSNGSTHVHESLKLLYRQKIEEILLGVLSFRDSPLAIKNMVAV